jgi:hypothetical protein
LVIFKDESCFSLKNFFTFEASLGVLFLQTMAENKPSEPDQDNACEWEKYEKKKIYSSVAVNAILCNGTARHKFATNWFARSGS